MVAIIASPDVTVFELRSLTALLGSIEFQLEDENSGYKRAIYKCFSRSQTVESLD